MHPTQAARLFAERLAKLQKLAARPDGVSREEAQKALKITRKAAIKFIGQAIAAGYEVRRVTEQYHGQLRLFLTAQQADEWVQKARAEALELSATRKAAEKAGESDRGRKRRERERAERIAQGLPVRRNPGEAQDIVLDLARRLHGVSTAEIAEALEVSLTSASSRADSMRKRGILFASSKHSGCVIRHFATPTAAAEHVPMAYVRQARRVVRDPCRKPNSTVLLPRERKGAAVVTINRTDLVRTGEPIITGATKWTFGVKPTAVDAPPIFSALPPGMYIAPASPWLTAAGVA